MNKQLSCCPPTPYKCSRGIHLMGESSPDDNNNNNRRKEDSQGPRFE